MAFELKQNLKLSQQLIMTPQLQQAIKLLQLSRLEMVDMINQEMEENPLLEETTPADYTEGEEEHEITDTQSIDREGAPVVERTEELTGEGDGKEEFDWNNYLEDYRPVGGTSYEHRESDASSWDNVLATPHSLTDHLMWQLKLSPLTEQEMAIGEQIIGNIDQDGYLRATPEEIIAQGDATPDEVESVLKKIQEFDPPGIAARDLTECLLLQAAALGHRGDAVEMIVRDHLKSLENRDYPHIARKLKLPLAEVLQAVSVISHMDPKPGSIYNEERIQNIIPDLYVFKVGNEYKIVLNDDGLPRLRISNFYREIMGGGGNNSQPDSSKRYIKDKVQSATWLIKSIQQRQRTIYRVAESIVKYQREFFDEGINYLKPLVLRDIAEDVEMHESTISRVVTNKYMHTPRGIFELKYFFSSSIHRDGGEAVASKSVKEDIRKIILSEDPKKPYSDLEIVDILKTSGVTIARRTVAKYREMMRILPSSKRKKYF
jgi:RNA polymerase sigma-54 factor